MRARHLSTSRLHLSTALIVLFDILAFAGCTVAPKVGQVGDLGKGNFAYECIGTTDMTCSIPESQLGFTVAVGARFGTTFQLLKTALSLPVSVANLDQVTTSVKGESFEVVGAGPFVLLATDGAEVVDFKHALAEEVAGVRVQVEGSGAVAPTLLPLGQTVVLVATVVDARGGRLRGALSYGWTADDSGVVSLEQLAESHRVTVTAARLGTTTLQVSAAGKLFSVPVKVVAALGDAGAPLDAGAFAVEGGLDASLMDASRPEPDGAVDHADGAVP